MTAADTGQLSRWGWDEGLAADLAALRPRPPGGAVVGRVVRQDRGALLAVSAAGPVVAGTRADRVGTPVVGDWVVVVDDEVAAVLPRRGVLRRADATGEREQVLAAHVDVVLATFGLDRPLKPGRLHRTLAQAADADADVLAVLTKADAVPDPAAAVDALAAQNPGLDVLAVSARTGAGLDALRDAIGPRTAVLLGESGAGKSSLLNALAGEDLAGTGAVRAGDAKGRHTTTRRELHVLDGGAIVIDTPGLRALGVFAEVESIAAAFPDIEGLAEDCRFRDCTHVREPGCAVQGAAEAGRLPAARLASYLELVAEAEFALRPEHERRPGRRR